MPKKPARKKPSLKVQLLNAAGDALFTIMADEDLADSLSYKIRNKIDRWYKLTLKYLGKE